MPLCFAITRPIDVDFFPRPHNDGAAFSCDSRRFKPELILVQF
jgi:hypothetical protein